MTESRHWGESAGTELLELGIRRGSKWREGGWGMSSGQSVESFVGLATGRPQSSCQVGNGRRERERGI